MENPYGPLENGKGDRPLSTNMFHPAAERLEAFVEGLLDAGDRVVVESHLVGCPNCRGEVDELKSLFSALARLERFSPKAGFANRVMLQVRVPKPQEERWYSKAGAFANAFIPKTRAAWAFASALVALPLVGFGTLVVWVLSRPYITGDGLLSFTLQELGSRATAFLGATLTGMVQSDVMLVLMRGVQAVVNAGFTNAGLVGVIFAALTAWSTRVLYQNLFRQTLFRHAPRRHDYVSFSF